MLLNKNKNSPGFGIIEVIIASILLGLLGLGVAKLISSQTNAIKSNRTAATRDGILNSLQRLSGDPSALTQSTTHASNLIFKQCISGCSPTSATCCSVPAATPQEFVLLDQSGNPAAGTSAGPDLVLYDIDGAPCSTPSPTCALRAIATFSATCAGGAAACPNAQSVQVRVQLEQNPAVTLSAGTRLKPRTTTTMSSSIPLTSALSGSGTKDYIAKYITSDQIGISNIFESSAGNIAIGTSSASPVSKFTVIGGGTHGYSLYTQATNGNTAYFNNLGNTSWLYFKDQSTPVNVIVGSMNGGFWVQTGGTSRFVVNASGNVGINNVAPGHPLTVGGVIYSSTNVIAQGQIIDYTLSPQGGVAMCRNNSSGVHSPCSSDKRLKKNIEYINESFLDKILALRPVEFNWKNQEGPKQVGFIAQDVRKLFPLTVEGDESKVNLAFSPGNLVPYLVKGIQELAEKNRMLESEVNELKEAICEIKPTLKKCKNPKQIFSKNF